MIFEFLGLNFVFFRIRKFVFFFGLFNFLRIKVFVDVFNMYVFVCVVLWMICLKL